MVQDQTRVGNIGTHVVVTIKKRDPENPSVFIPVDLTPVTPRGNVKIEFARPDSSKQIKDASIKDPAISGVIELTDDDGDIFNHSRAKHGPWQQRGIVTFSNGDIFKGSWELYPVGE